MEEEEKGDEKEVGEEEEGEEEEGSGVCVCVCVCVFEIVCVFREGKHIRIVISAAIHYTHTVLNTFILLKPNQTKPFHVDKTKCTYVHTGTCTHTSQASGG